MFQHAAEGVLIHFHLKLRDELKAGQTVTMTFDIRGREYNGRYFNNFMASAI